METKTTNPNLRKLVNKLENKGKQEGMPFLIDLSERLSKSRQNRAEVNISKINRLAEGDGIIVVPGKVLGYGVLDKDLKVASFKFSDQAKNKIESAGGECLSVRDLIDEDLSGENLRIME